MSSRGFAVVAAIFLTVVLAALGAFMVSLSTTQHSAATLDLMGSRAYQAAHAGLEWGAWQALKNGAAYGCTAGAATDTLSFSGNLADFTTTVACSSSDFDEAGNTVRIYQFTATAKAGTPGQANYVERVLTATVARCTDGGGNPC